MNSSAETDSHHNSQLLWLQVKLWNALGVRCMIKEI